MDQLFHYQRCRNNNCNFYHYFPISLNSNNDERKYIFDETEKKLYLFEYKECKMITFLDIETITIEKIFVFFFFFLKKKRTVLLKARENFRDEKIKWEKRRKQSKRIRKIIF